MKNKLQIILFLMVFGLTNSSVYAQSNQYTQSKQKVVNLKVDGMISDVCPVLLKSAVRKMKGVTKVDASYKNHSATIAFDENQTTLADIQKAIKAKVGFDTEVK